jgi:glycosyltransferase involved in cell wall biosynthesis
MARRVLLDVGPATGGHGQRGIGRQVRGIVESLQEWPPDRRELVWAVGQPSPTLRLLGDRGIESRLSRIRPTDLGLALGRLAENAALRRSGAQVLHSTDPFRPWTSSHVLRIVNAYDLIPLREPGLQASWRPHHRFAYRAFLNQLRSADLIVANSQMTAVDVAERLAVPENRIVVVSPVVVAPMRLPTHKEPAVPTFLYVGGLDVSKQPELGVEALARFRERHGEGRLVFVGPSSERQRAGLLDRARGAGVLQAVDLRGHVPDEELESMYLTATALLSTSRLEGFGLPPVEAALRGCPVISVDIPTARETVGEVATLVPSDPEAVAAAMANPRPPAPEAVARLAARYSRRAAAEALWAAYEPLIG